MTLILDMYACIITCKHYIPKTQPNILFQSLHEKFKSIYMYLDINSNLNKIRIHNLEICIIPYFNIKNKHKKGHT